MGHKQKSKTPQPQRGPKALGNKTPQSAPAPGKKQQFKKGPNEVSMKAVTGKLFQNGQGTPGKGKGTPKPGEKRKFDTSLQSNKKPQTPVALPKGKATPGKTPQGMKTPQAKTPVPAGKGGKKTPQKPADDDDDDDDEDDEDFEEFDMDSDDDDDDDDESLEEDMDDDDDDDDEEGPSPKKAALAKNGAKMQQEDDDDDSEDDEDEDDDEDDDDDDEEDDDEESILKNIKALRKEGDKPGQKQAPVAKPNDKAQKQQQQQKQQNDKAQKQQQQKQQQQNQQKQSQAQAKPAPQAQSSVVADASGDAKRKEDRDKCTLFLKNLPPTTNVADIKALSKDIKEVRMRITVRAKNRQKTKLVFAYVEFASEAVADKNFKALKGAKVKGTDVMVDYVGEKSSYAPVKKESADPDPLRLYITGFGWDVKEADLYKLFPKAEEVILPKRKKDKTAIGYAFARFATPEQCKAAHDKGQGARVNAHSLVVLYAKKRTSEQFKKDQKIAQKIEDDKNKPRVKKVKLDVKKKAEEDDDDDDDDDDEEDDDEDEDDESDEDDDDEDDDDDDDDDDEDDED